jgi:type I restriction enzyme S subunit
MDRKQLLQHFETLADTLEAVAKLRALVLDLAIRGRLVPQAAKDHPFAGELARKNTSEEMQNIYTLPPKWKWLLLSQVAVLIRGVSYRLSFPLPPLAEQQQIVAKVDELLRWCDALEARLTAAQTTGAHLLDLTLHQILTPAA